MKTPAKLERGSAIKIPRSVNLGILLVAASVVSGCLSTQRVSQDSQYNYAVVFKDVQSASPVVLNSRLERFTKNFGFGPGKEQNGEWEFELLANRTWVNEVKTGFLATTSEYGFRRPAVPWWKPDAASFDAFQMPYSSYSAAHLFVEKSPKDEDHIRVFIQRH